MRQSVNAYLLRVIAQRVLGLLLYLLGSWWALSVRAGIFFGCYFVFAIVSMAVMVRVSPQTLAARGTPAGNTPAWDKFLLGAYWILSFFAVYLAAGISAKTAPEIGVVFWVGIALQALASALSLWALAVNPFLESTARIQSDRNQTVCKSGPYAFVRHPTYSSVVLWCVSVSMAFESIPVAVIALTALAIIVVRTALEDAMLRRELAGYAAYTRRVRYRLIPFIW